MSFCRTAAVAFHLSAVVWVFSTGQLAADVSPLYDPDLERAGQLLLDMRLEEAEKLIGNSIERNAEKPAGYFFRSAALSWRIFLAPERSDTKELKKEFEKALSTSRRFAEKAQSRSESRFEGTLYLGAVYGQEALLALLDKKYLLMAPLARRAWNYLQEAVSLDPEYYDSYFGLGIYKYFTDVLPRMIKILALAYGFEGDREGGLTDLWLAVEKGLYSRDEAGIMLLNIYSITETPDSSLGALASELHRRYPDNPLIHWRYGDILFRMKKYAEAGKIYQEVAERIEAGHPFYRNSMFSAYSIAYRLGACDRHLGKNREALERFKSILKAHDVTPEWVVPVSYLECGSLYLAEGNTALAEKSLKAVLQYKDFSGSHSKAKALLEKLEHE